DVTAQATLTIVATVTAPGPQINNASVSSFAGVDPNPLNDRAAASVNAGGTADIAVDKGVSSAAPAVGTSVTYTVTARNLGPDTATGVTVSDTLPAGLTFVSATASQGTYESVTGAWTLGAALPAGALETLAIMARVDAAGTIVNTAT